GLVVRGRAPLLLPRRALLAAVGAIDLGLPPRLSPGRACGSARASGAGPVLLRDHERYPGAEVAAPRTEVVGLADRVHAHVVPPGDPVERLPPADDVHGFPRRRIYWREHDQDQI